MIRCLLVDDEPLARRLLASFVARVPFLQLVGECDNALAALEVLQCEPVDVLFLDIKMPDLTGLEMVRTLRPTAQVVFTTAFEQYAVESFQLHVTDYLVKPIAFERFLLAAQRVQQRMATASAVSTTSADAFIFVKADYHTQRLPLREIRYLEGLKDYIKIHIAAPRPILTNSSMRAFEDLLPAADFVRVHKSFIVALGWIDSIRKSRIYLGDAVIPVGEAYAQAFNQLIASRRPS